MNAVIRLDDKGSPYLIVNYEDREGAEQTASDDAERLFFTRLNQNGGLLHLVPGKGKQVRMLVTTGAVKRKYSVTDGMILGSPTMANGSIFGADLSLKDVQVSADTTQSEKDAALGEDLGCLDPK